MEKKGTASMDAGPVTDIADLMNDWFFGSVSTNNGVSNLTSKSKKKKKKESSGKSSRLTQEWLDEAKKMVVGSPSRGGSPARFVGSPRFIAPQGREASPLLLDRRDPLSRSARRNRSTESISDEILQRSTHRHSRTNSEVFFATDHLPASPNAQTNQCFSLVFNSTISSSSAAADHNPPLLPKQPSHRKSRFHHSHSDGDRHFLSPPRNLVESSHRRSVSSSTCSLDKLSRRAVSDEHRLDAAVERETNDDVKRLNAFLRNQRSLIGKISRGEASAEAKFILSSASSASSNSTTSSIVAAICYAWLLVNIEKGHGDRGMVVAPVVNMRRERMLKHRQAAWLLYHIGIDASALLFADEVDLEGLIMTRQLSIVVVGQDILKTNGEVHSQCTFLTDNYCEESYNLLQSPNIKKLLLAGILSDTQNLNTTGKSSTNRDSEAVQLLLVGSTPNKRHELFRQLMQDHKEHSFLESLKTVYGKPSNDDNDERRMSHDHTPPRRNSTSVSHQDEFTPNSANQKPAPPASAQVVPEAGSRGKNKFFLAKWFGFGSK